MKALSSLPVAALITALMLTGCAETPTSAIDDDGFAAIELATSDMRANNAPVRLTFEKVALAEGVWEGTVSGAFDGDLRTELMDLREAGNIWHVDFAWIITGTPDGDYDFTAHLSGTLNLNTGRVVMNGRVVEGYLRGAQVHEEGQLVDPVDSAFGGYIRIMPATAGR